MLFLLYIHWSSISQYASIIYVGVLWYFLWKWNCLPLFDFMDGRFCVTQRNICIKTTCNHLLHERIRSCQPTRLSLKAGLTSLSSDAQWKWAVNSSHQLVVLIARRKQSRTLQELLMRSWQQLERMTLRRPLSWLIRYTFWLCSLIWSFTIFSPHEPWLFIYSMCIMLYIVLMYNIIPQCIWTESIIIKKSIHLPNLSWSAFWWTLQNFNHWAVNIFLPIAPWSQLPLERLVAIVGKGSDKEGDSPPWMQNLLCFPAYQNQSGICLSRNCIIVR